MNNGGAQGQPPQGQPSGAQGQQRKPPFPMYKPEQMRTLPDIFSASEKEKWEQGLKSLWGQIEKFPADTTAHQEAKRKLFEFSRTLFTKLQAHRQGQLGQQGQQGQGQQGAVARPASQGQPQAQEGDPMSANPNNAQQGNQQRPPIPAKILEHIHSFPYTVPAQIQPNTPEAAKWIQEAKSRYVKGLMAMDAATTRIATYDAMYQKRNEEGRPLNAEEEKEYRDKKEQCAKQHSEAKQFVEGFRRQQQMQQHQARQSGTGQQDNVPGGNGTGSATQTPVRGPMSATQTQNPALQNTQTVNAAIQAARNQQMGEGRPNMPQNGQGQLQNPNAPSHQNVPQHQGGQVQTIKQEAGVPQINTQMQGRPMPNNSPQSAIPQSAQSQGPPQSAVSQVPRALTHPQALQTAARTYSSGQTSGTPNVMGHSHTHPSAPRETQNVITNKMPIPKHLPERATLTPQPIQMPASRPTLTGGPSYGNGVLSQPVLHKTPGYSMEGEGDRVLNKKKLDELVRQVTGGGDGLGGEETLTPEVESVYSLLSTIAQR
jgi:transcription initiation factor TFIID subunit 12